ncbi:MAG: MMPL family transporter, partial [Firmicutes bacterium]|nr:MMPL family transporter [Bacillota bacterium]
MPKEKQTFMEKMATFIVYKRKTILFIYLAMFIFCVLAMGWVKVENDVTKYLPEDTETRQGIDVMNANFKPAATARIMVSNVTFETAEDLNTAIGNVDGVEMSTFDNTEDHYKDAAALFDVNLSGSNNDPDTIQTMEDIRGILENYDASIDTLVGYDENAMLANEMMVITVVAVIIILVVLTLTSRAYAEVPVLLLTFGAAALLNMGTNFIFGTISFISNSIAVVLQLALAVDYAIILCHRFSDENETKPAIEAAIAALSKAIPEIGASSLTTIGGLGALAFMKFSIGADMAMVLIKSILLSLLSVFTLMPGLLVFFSPLINRTKHRKLLPKITLIGKFAVKVRHILPPIFVLLLVGAFYLSNLCPYCYSYNDLKTAKMAERQHAYFKIKDTFGTSNMAAVVVPAGNYEAESKILEELAACPQVESTMGLAGIEAMNGYMLTDALTPRELAELIGLDNEITEVLYTAYAATENEYGKIINGIAEYRVPLFDMFIFLKDQMETRNIELEGMEDMTDMLSQLDTAKEQMQSENYSRMVVYLNVPEEGEETYNFLQEMRGIIGQYYEDDYYIVGNSTSSRDLSASFETDNLLITVLSIFFVILV